MRTFTGATVARTLGCLDDDPDSKDCVMVVEVRGASGEGFRLCYSEPNRLAAVAHALLGAAWELEYAREHGFELAADHFGLVIDGAEPEHEFQRGELERHEASSGDR